MIQGGRITTFEAVLDFISKEKASDMGTNSSFDFEISCLVEQSHVKLVLFDLIPAARALGTNYLHFTITFCSFLAL